MAAPLPTRRTVALAGLALLATGSAGAITPLDPIVALVDSIRRRLDVAPGVAKAKWNAKGSIEDLEREAALLARVAAEAPGFGLDPARAARFMRAQIEASKVVQAGLFAAWARQARPPFPDAPDLKTEVRPILDRLTPELLARLGPALAQLAQAGPARLVEATGHDDALVAAALAVATAPLLEWSRA